MQELQARLQHTFKDEALLALALTHTSAGRVQGGSNERLEFLGDRVLGLLIAEWLCAVFPDESEGALAKRHARLVSRETLLNVAESLGVQDFMRVAPNDGLLKQARARGILADAMEALIAALYLDGGLEAARRVVREHWAAALHAADTPPQDAKSALQEWAQGRGLPAPTYSEKARQGPAHRPQFTMAVQVAGWPAVEATGASKKLAEQAAAEALLAQVQSV